MPPERPPHDYRAGTVSGATFARTISDVRIVHSLRRAGRRAVVPCLLIAASALAREGHASGGRAAFRLFGDQEGLANTSVERLLQDRAGFLWVGTQDGLFRFDGRGFTRYGRDEGLPSGRCNDLFESRAGTLFVGTRAGLARRAGDRFLTLGPEHGLPAAPVSDRGIVEDKAGRIFVATQKGLFVGDGDRFGAVERPGLAGSASALDAGNRGDDLVTALLALPDGGLLYARGRRLLRWRDGAEEDFGAAHGLGVAERIDQMAQDGAGRLWVRTLSELWVLEEPSRPHALFRALSAEVPAAISTGRIDVDATGEVMLPTGRGLLLRRGDAWRALGVEQGLPAPTALSSLVDREGTLWIGLAGAGLAQRLGSGALSTFTAADGLPDDVVWGIARAAAGPGAGGGALYVATEEGLARAELAPHGDVARIAPVAGTHGTFYAVVAAPDGSVWAGSWPGGVLRLGPEPGRLRRYGARGHAAADFKVIALHLRGNAVWAGAADGVYRLGADDVFAPAGAGDGEAPDSVYAFAEWQGELWCAGRFGLQRLTGPAPRRFRARDGLRADFVASLAVEADGALWAGYREALGLDRVRLAGDGIATTPLARAQGLGSDKVLFLGRDVRDRAWVGTAAGVDLLAADGRPLRHFARADGLPTEDMDQNAFYGGDADAVWLGSSRGLVRFDLAAPAPMPAAPAVLLTEAWSGARRLSLDDPLTLAAAERSLLLRFAALTFVDPGHVRFRYRLEGLEDAETETAVPEARFSMLPKGRFRFHVVAISGGGIASPVPATVNVDVAPRWFETGPARLLFVLLGLAAIVGLVALRTRALERDRRRLEAAVAERSRELAAALRDLEDQSFTDPLTKARNRRFLTAAIDREVARTLRETSAGNTGAGLLFVLLDLDHFKDINDRSGHAAGDRVLVEASRRIAAACRESDLLVRWGGEEFLIVATHAGPERGPALAARLLEAFRGAPFPLGDGGARRQTCSIGWAPFPFDPRAPAALPATWEAAVDLADRALYVAKQEGRDRAVGVLPPETPADAALPAVPLPDLDGSRVRLVRSES